ncbi:MAG: 3-oxoacyl-[acyl-carrier protein] reductase [Candidatus Azotimanducaceae bacterium]|jgi:3-oxoacyl-[acyl-carrier protein] reductase
MERRMKTLIVTGASKGIGFAVAQTFLSAGYRVINLSRSPAPDDAIENHAIDLSLSDCEEQLRELMELLITDGEICVVHNAAKMINDSALDAGSDGLRDLLAINVMAPHILNQAVLPHMQAGSSIIYLGSTLSEKAVANTYSYVITKHAIVGMMRSTCQDLAGTGIHTACVCPGFTDTEMLRTHVGDDQEVLRSIAAASTFGRLVAPKEIADTVYFAAANAVMNGAILHANLGQVEH